MPNEFEKQVQQMMDELKLVPSEPVWQKVEMQIREKKDRRRVIFWILFSALLVGGGLWVGINQYSNHVSNKQNSVIKKEHQREQDQTSPVNNITTADKNNTTNSTTKTNIVAKEIVVSQQARKIEKPLLKTNEAFSAPLIQNKISEVDEQAQNTGVGKIQTRVKTGEADSNATAKTEAVKQGSVEKVLREAVPNLNIQHNQDTTRREVADNKKNQPGVSMDDSIKHDVSINDSIRKQDTVAVQKASIKKYASSKWKLNFVAAAGSSTLSDVNLFSDLFGGQKSLATAPSYNSGGSIGSGGQFYYGPSDVKKGFSFSAGALAKKQLSKRTAFSTGLQYNYYSNTIQVGNKINQNRTLMDFSVSQYYTNSGTSLRPYKNQYHFLSLPFAMDWQLLKKLPLNLHTGLSMQYLVNTNGLVFDYSAQSYFNSKDAFNRVQLFFEPALTYSVFLKQRTLSFGPQWKYGLTGLEKNSSTYHLSSFGLKAQLQLGKN